MLTTISIRTCLGQLGKIQVLSCGGSTHVLRVTIVNCHAVQPAPISIQDNAILESLCIRLNKLRCIMGSVKEASKKDFDLLCSFRLISNNNIIIK